MQTYVLRIPTSGGAEEIALSEPITAQTLAELLQTDVTERMRIPVMPDAFGDDCVLCYFIDARGGDKALAANFLGTCFYHTGCPVYGDLLIAKCSAESENAAVSGFSETELHTLRDWLTEQFPAYLNAF